MKLDQIIPDEATRRIVYVVFGVIGLALGVSQTVVASLEQSQPAWLTAAFAVYAYLAAAGFTVSQANTSNTPETVVIGSQEEGFAQPDLGLVTLSNPEPVEGDEGQEAPTAGSIPQDAPKHA